MTPVRLAALRILAAAGDRGVTGRVFAERMWPDSPAWAHQSKAGTHGTRSGAGMPRAAGSLLSVMVREGLAQRDYGRDNRVSTYYISEAGRRALKEAP